MKRHADANSGNHTDLWPLNNLPYSTHDLTALISPHNTKRSALHKQEWNEKEVKWPERERQMNKFVCVRTGVKKLLHGNIIYLHNLHKLLWCHITRFMPAFRRRSLSPVFAWGRVRATCRLGRRLLWWSLKKQQFGLPLKRKILKMSLIISDFIVYVYWSFRTDIWFWILNNCAAVS